jgi:hypothetical protein
MWSRAELEGALRDAGLANWAARLAQLARHRIIFVPGEIAEAADAPLGGSRLGGEPDLPPEVDWSARPPFKPKSEAILAGPMPGRVLLGPRYWLHWLFRTQRWRDAVAGWERSRQTERDVHDRAWPMSFVAQIDFAELHAVHALTASRGPAGFSCSSIPSTGRGASRRIRRAHAPCSSTRRRIAWSAGVRRPSSTRPRRKT